MVANIIAHVPYAKRSILSILGYVPKQGEDIAYLVSVALAQEAMGNNGDKDLDLPPIQLEVVGGKLTGNVLLFRYSSQPEESYLEERLSHYDDDPLYWELAQNSDVRNYTHIKTPTGDSISYCTSIKKGQHV